MQRSDSNVSCKEKLKKYKKPTNELHKLHKQSISEIERESTRYSVIAWDSYAKLTAQVDNKWRRDECLLEAIFSIQGLE